MVIGRKIGTAKNMTISSDLWFLFFTLFWSWWENVWRSCRLLEYQIPNLIIDLKQHLRKNQEIVVMTIKVLDWGGNQQFPIENALSVHKSVENVHFLWNFCHTHFHSPPNLRFQIPKKAASHSPASALPYNIELTVCDYNCQIDKRWRWTI